MEFLLEYRLSFHFYGHEKGFDWKLMKVALF